MCIKACTSDFHKAECKKFKLAQAVFDKRTGIRKLHPVDVNFQVEKLSTRVGFEKYHLRAERNLFSSVSTYLRFSHSVI